jgi:hypothetical protein
MADLEPGVVLSPSTVAAMERLSTSSRTAMTKQHKATTEQWKHAEACAPEDFAGYACILELRSRIEMLEAAQHNPRAALDAQPELRWSGPLPQLVTSPTAIRPVDRYELGDAIRRAWLKHGRDSWFAIADEVFAALAQPRAVYDLGRQHGAAPIRSGPESPLVERVADAIQHEDGDGIAPAWEPEARAAILEVAAWLREQGTPASGWAMRLESEANQ